MKRITAILTGTVMLCTAMPALPVSAEYSTASEEKFILPDWVPQSFEDAVEFSNTYGSSRAYDDVYCIVTRVSQGQNASCNDKVGSGNAECVFQTTLSYELRDGMPDLASMPAEERREWEEKLALEAQFAEYNKDVRYFVSVWKPTRAGEVTIHRAVTLNDETPSRPVTETFTFQVADDVLHVAESGWRAVVPDCITEYEAFKAEHGSFYANDNILVLADTVNYSTGADMKMQVKQGILTLEPAGGFNCREQSMGPEKAGSSEKIVQYYQIQSGSTATLEASIKHTTSSGSVTVENAYYKCMRNTAGGLYLEQYEPQFGSLSIPDWVPDSYEKAIEFLNAYGTTHAEDGLFCTVKRISASCDAIKADTEIALGSPACELVLDRMLEYEQLIADPNPNATPEQKAAFERWMQEQAIIGSYNQDVTYYVTLWKPQQPGDVTLNETIVMPNGRGNQKVAVQDTYTFTVAADTLYTAETGWRAYVPDCAAEYAAFVEQNGNIAGAGPYLVCAAVNNSSVGSKMYTMAELNSQPLNPVRRLDCTGIALTPPPAGSRESVVDFYLVEDEGKVHAAVQITGEGKKTEQNLKAIRDTAGCITLIKDGDAAVSDFASDIPSWVPDSYESALEFLNLYGEVRCGTDAQARNGMFCLCIMNDSPARYSFEPSSYIDDGANYEETGRWVFGQDGRAVHVFLYRALTAGRIALEWQQQDMPTTATDALRIIPTGKVHVFEAASDLSVREVGLNALLPDCWYEANTFAQTNGGISLLECNHENYIVCCGSFNASTGYKMAAELAGSGKLDGVTEYDVVLNHAAVSTDDGGGTTYRIMVFKPAGKGLVKINQLFPRTFPSSERLVRETKYYNVDENGAVTEVKIRKGDVNGDTEITTADLVLALKFMGGQLTGSNALTEAQMFAADVLNDNRLNAADISMLKRIIMQIKNPPPPAA